MQGASFIALVATLTVVPTIPVAGMALLLGIDRFMSTARALVNMIGNGVATVVVARWEKEIDRANAATKSRHSGFGCASFRRTVMPRIRPIEDSEATETQRLLIESARVNGAPDPLCARIYVRSEAGRNWLRMWNELLNGGILPIPLKEAVRVLISTKHFCGYCSTVRSNVAIRSRSDRGQSACHHAF